MEIKIAGFIFSFQPISRPGNVFMQSPEGDGTEIDEMKIGEVLRKLFDEVM